MSDTFRISYSMDATLSKKDLWPNGGAPENPTVSDVLDLIKRHGGRLGVLDSWSLDYTSGQLAVTAIPGEDK